MSSVRSRPSFAYTSHNTAQLIRGGGAYFTLLLSLIDKALHTIHLQVYIYDEDETGQEVAVALMAAARRGVAVYLLVDGYASQNLPAHFISKLEQEGIHFRFFQPLLKSDHFYFGRRLHHKIAVIDARYSLVGGINISNKYNDGFDQPAWLDWALYTEGEIVPELVRVCLELWTKSKRERKKLLWQTHPPVGQPQPACAIRLRRNDWVQKERRSRIVIWACLKKPGRIYTLCPAISYRACWCGRKWPAPPEEG
ncbi:phospholipase D-like domain-containing protein [Paraflavitalea speifideaquila]|uniref:phospholipase D-like domain-containing protein n=1 Tax=Paraflavitalea speifideaquila TaxID=3076558 RepID=UPI0028EDAC30|nr:phospholipase D-like domain-containing protein [Paraflavitalea speifideiaquila]